MNDGTIQPQIRAIEQALSADRFAPYVLSCRQDKVAALSLYELNTRVSASLYAPLQTLEVTLRNIFHLSLSDAFGEWWFDRPDVIWGLSQHRKIAEAKLNLVKDKKSLSPGRIIASLTFGFWTSLLAGQYDQVLWQRGNLQMTFRGTGERPKRGKINSMLTPLRHLRNRVAHHEPILYFDLPKHHTNILTLTEWLSPVAGRWAAAASDFPKVYDEKAARTLLAPSCRSIEAR